MEFKLRKWEIYDIDSLVKHANNINVAKYLTDGFPHPYTREDGEEFINSIKDDNPAKIFAIDFNGEAIGSIGIYPEQSIHRKNAELGYWLSEDYWGKGIMPEAIKRMTEYAFNTFEITRIYARPFGINTNSQRVLEKSGFTFEAKFEKTVYKNGEYHDEIYYSIRRNF